MPHRSSSASSRSLRSSRKLRRRITISALHARDWMTTRAPRPLSTAQSRAIRAFSLLARTSSRSICLAATSTPPARPRTHSSRPPRIRHARSTRAASLPCAPATRRRHCTTSVCSRATTHRTRWRTTILRSPNNNSAGSKTPNASCARRSRFHRTTRAPVLLHEGRKDEARVAFDAAAQSTQDATLRNLASSLRDAIEASAR